MKYALFAWEPYEQRGGVGDLECTGSLDECKAAFAEYVERQGGDACGHIVDVADLRVAYEADVTPVRAPDKSAWERADSWAIAWE